MSAIHISQNYGTTTYTPKPVLLMQTPVSGNITYNII